MRKFITLILAALVCIMPLAAQTQARALGADISWCTEMEADGMQFYNADGQPTDIFVLLRQIGMNAVRLRVWANPEQRYGAWSDRADVLAKARRAKAAGLDVLLAFHYSDYFADPGKQTKPQIWATLPFDNLKAAMVAHTVDMLQALRDEGIEPRWVQVGNETTSGLLWPEGRIRWNEPDSVRWLNYIALSNAAYDAVKSVCPNAYVIVHHDMGRIDQTWYYTAFSKYGGKFDMIGITHYPDWDKWGEQNTLVANYLRKMHTTFRVPVMIVETAYSNWDEPRAAMVMRDFVQKLSRAPGYAGIFYWEPEVYGGWEHWLRDDGTSQYNTGTRGAKVSGYGAFTPDGRPAEALYVISGQPVPSGSR